MTSGVALSVIVSTIGRPDDLRRLIDSLVAQDRRDELELIVVDQSDDGSCSALLAELDLPFDCRWTTSTRGVSVGRNAARRWRLVGCSRSRTTAAGTPGHRQRCVGPGSGTRCAGCHQRDQVTDDGQLSMLRWPDSARPITRRNVQLTAIESTIFASAVCSNR
jgi:glycosyltransferase involved in cell wall biosynthesis